MSLPYRIVVLPNLSGQLGVAFEPLPFLFNEPRHLLSQAPEGSLTFLLFRHDTIVARFCGFTQHSTLVSPLKGTFGGLEVSDLIPESVIGQFLVFVEAWSKRHGLVGIRFVQAPNALLGSVADKLNNTLQKSGYQIITQETNQHIVVTAQPTSALLHRSALRKLRKCQRGGLAFRELSAAALPEFHALLSEARQRKQRPVSLSLLQLQRLFDTLPNDFRLVGVFDQQRLVSACVVVRLNAHMLYYFLPADHPDYQSFSPSVMLLSGLYEYAQQTHCTIIDLGVSSLEGEVNQGLFRFKRSVGAESSARFTWYKPL